jgi:hypothetical protein
MPHGEQIPVKLAKKRKALVADQFLSQTEPLRRLDSSVKDAMARRTEHPEHVTQIFIECAPSTVSPKRRFVRDIEDTGLVAARCLAHGRKIGVSLSQPSDEGIRPILVGAAAVVGLHRLRIVGRESGHVAAACCQPASRRAIFLVRSSVLRPEERCAADRAAHWRAQPVTGGRPVAPGGRGVCATSLRAIARRFVPRREALGAMRAVSIEFLSVGAGAVHG